MGLDDQVAIVVIGCTGIICLVMTVAMIIITSSIEKMIEAMEGHVAVKISVNMEAADITGRQPSTSL